MSTQPIELPWDQPGWLEQVAAWVAEQLAASGRQITEPLALVHQRPWAAFARIGTDQGVAYFKAPSPLITHEAALTQALAAWRPDCTVPLLATDLARGWFLSADIGTTLRQLDRTAGQIAHWQQLLPQYSEFQIALAERLPDCLALGVPDRRLAELPQAYAQLLEATASLRIGLEPGLTAAEYQQLQDGQARFAEQCAALAANGLPETLVHEELHENNVLFGSGRYTYTDWSDCSVGHPFCTMLVTLRATAHWLKLDEHGPEIQRLRDAYLEPWTTFAPRASLDAALALAYRIAMVYRALAWHQALGQVPEQAKLEYADSVCGWLQDYLLAG